MLRIVNLEEIKGMLLRIPDLVDRLDQRDPGFVQEVKHWLQATEQVLENNKMPVAGNVASLRGMLTAAERGLTPAGIELHSRPTGRKIRDAVAAETIRRVDDLVSDAIREDVSRIAEAERVSHQLVALAHFKKLIPEGLGTDYPTEHLKAIWHAMSADPDIGPGATHLLGLTGPHDALILLDRAITAFVSSAIRPQPSPPPHKK